jgi:hypothetical protein
LRKCKSEIAVDVEITGAEGDVTEVEGVTVVLSADESGSEVGMDGLDEDADVVGTEEASKSVETIHPAGCASDAPRAG